MESTECSNDQLSQAPPATSGLDNLPAFPSNGQSEVPIIGRQFPVVEISAGAVLGLTAGVAIAWVVLAEGGQVSSFFFSVGIAVFVGAIVGGIVGRVTGPTGEFSVSTVLAAIPRVIAASTIGLLFGVVFAMTGMVFMPRQRNDDD